MAEFLTGEILDKRITDIIFYAKSDLIILSPYIKLDEYFKKLFDNHRHNPDLHIIILFGKNEDNKGRSLSESDFSFFKQFPNVSILYLKHLHAKYYANESGGVITSINLYEYSFKNNIEFGVYSKSPEIRILGITSVNNPFSEKLDNNAFSEASKLIRAADVVFIKRHLIQKKFIGSHYVGSEVLHDITNYLSKRISEKHQRQVTKNIDDFPDFIEYGRAGAKEKPLRDDIADVRNNPSSERMISGFYKQQKTVHNHDQTEMMAFVPAKEFL